MALPLVLLVIVVLAIIGQAVATLAVNHSRIANRAKDDLLARQQARAGLTEAKLVASQNWSGFANTLDQRPYVSDPTRRAGYKLTVIEATSSFVEFTSEGFVKNSDDTLSARSTMRMRLALSSGGAYFCPVLADNSFQGTNSRLENPGGIALRTNSTQPGALSGSTTIVGAVKVGPVHPPALPTSVATLNPAPSDVQKTSITPLPSQVLPSLAAPPSNPESAGNVNVNGGAQNLSGTRYDDISVNGGTVKLVESARFRDVVVDGGGTLLLTGGKAYAGGSITVRGSSTAQLAPGTYGGLTLSGGNLSLLPGNYVFTGAVNVEGAAKVTAAQGAATVCLDYNAPGDLPSMSITGPGVELNLGKPAANLTFQGTDNCRNIVFRNDASHVASVVINAPRATLDFTDVTLSGAIVCAAFKGSGSKITFDSSLSDDGKNTDLTPGNGRHTGNTGNNGNFNDNINNNNGNNESGGLNDGSNDSAPSGDGERGSGGGGVTVVSFQETN